MAVASGNDSDILNQSIYSQSMTTILRSLSSYMNGYNHYTDNNCFKQHRVDEAAEFSTYKQGRPIHGPWAQPIGLRPGKNRGAKKKKKKISHRLINRV